MTAKEAVMDVLMQAPEDATFEDIMYQIHVREKIEVGLRDIEEGNLVSLEEAAVRLGKWDTK